MSNHSNLVFVYGSLKKGFQNHGLLLYHNAKELGKATLTGNYKMISLGAFPGVVLVDNHKGTIKGELYVVSKSGLDALDRLEGHPNFYKRKSVKLDSGIIAWCYFYPVEHTYVPTETIVTSGDWQKELY